MNNINEDIAEIDENLTHLSVVRVFARLNEDKISLRMMNNDSLLAEFFVHKDENFNERFSCSEKDYIGCTGEFYQRGDGCGSYGFWFNLNNILDISEEETLIYQKQHKVSFNYDEEDVQKLEIKLDDLILFDVWATKEDFPNFLYNGGDCITDTNGMINVSEDEDNFIIDICETEVDWLFIEARGYFPSSVYNEFLKQKTKNNKLIIRVSEYDVDYNSVKTKKTTELTFLLNDIPVCVMNFSKNKESLDEQLFFMENEKMKFSTIVPFETITEGLTKASEKAMPRLRMLFDLEENTAGYFEDKGLIQNEVIYERECEYEFISSEDKIELRIDDETFFSFNKNNEMKENSREINFSYEEDDVGFKLLYSKHL